MSKRWGQEGFTMVEMGVTIAIIGILAAIAIPSFINFMPRARIGKATQTLANEIAMSRMAAIAKSTDFQVVFDKTNEQYRLRQFVGGAWQEGTLTNLSASLDIESLEYKDGTAAPATLQLNATGTTSVPMQKECLYVTIQTKDGTVKRRVVVWSTGRVATEKWTSGTSWVAD